MEHQKLKEARTAKGLTQVQMAKKIAMEQTTYSRKERGLSPIIEEEWERFAKALNIPVDEIKEINTISKNENCTFQDNSIGIQYVNIPQNIFDIIIKYNQKLEEENQSLKAQLNIL